MESLLIKALLYMTGRTLHPTQKNPALFSTTNTNHYTVYPYVTNHVLPAILSPTDLYQQNKLSKYECTK